MSHNENEIKFYGLGVIHADPTIQSDERDAFADPIADGLPSKFRDGWDAGQNIAIVYPANEADKKRAVAQRKERVAAWEKQAEETFYPHIEGDEKVPSDVAKITYGELARFAKSIWVDAKGKWVEPEFLHNSCIRRGFAAPASALVWAASGEKRRPESFKIPAQIREYHNLEDQAIDRWRENDLEGRVGYTQADNLSRMVKLVKWGKTETECMARLNLQRGMAQKLHKLAMLTIKFPELKILERCHKPVVLQGEKGDKKPVYTKGGPLLMTMRPAELANLLSKDAKSDDKLLSVKAMGKQKGPATAEQVEKYFRLLFGGRENTPKTVGPDSLRTIVGSTDPEKLTPVGRAVYDALQAILANEQEAIRPLLTEKK